LPWAGPLSLTGATGVGWAALASRLARGGVS
jgi:hypothetical protein